MCNPSPPLPNFILPSPGHPCLHGRRGGACANPNLRSSLQQRQHRCPRLPVQLRPVHHRQTHRCPAPRAPECNLRPLCPRHVPARRRVCCIVPATPASRRRHTRMPPVPSEHVPCCAAGWGHGAGAVGRTDHRHCLPAMQRAVVSCVWRGQRVHLRRGRCSGRWQMRPQRRHSHSLHLAPPRRRVQRNVRQMLCERVRVSPVYRCSRTLPPPRLCGHRLLELTICVYGVLHTAHRLFRLLLEQELDASVSFQAVTTTTTPIAITFSACRIDTRLCFAAALLQSVRPLCLCLACTPTTHTHTPHHTTPHHTHNTHHTTHTHTHTHTDSLPCILLFCVAIVTACF